MFSLKNGNVQARDGQISSIIVDAAWRKEDLWSTVAWCIVLPQRTVGLQFSSIFKAHSPLQAETVACLKAILWAKDNGWRTVTFLSDFLVMIQALCYPDQADHRIRPLIKDILNVATNFFSVCNVIKVNKSLVQLAHRLAKLALSHI